MYINENIKKEMKQMIERIQNLEAQAKLYTGKDSENILNNKEKIEEQYNIKKQEILKEYNEILADAKKQYKDKTQILKNQLQEEKNSFSENTNTKLEDYKTRIQKLEEEKKTYISDTQTINNIQNNIEKIQMQMEEMKSEEEAKISEIIERKEKKLNEKINNAKEQIETKINQTRKELEEIGVNTQLFTLEDEKEIETNKKNINNKEMDENKMQHEKIEKVNNTKGNYNQKHNISVVYFAKEGKYVVTNKENGQKVQIQIPKTPIDQEALFKGVNISKEQIQNIDINMLRVLHQYDKKNNTNEMIKYKNIVTQTNLSKREMKEQMSKGKISIEYNLKGLNEKETSYTQEEKQEILNNANIAKNIGAAKVKKGILVRAKEIIDSATNKIKLLPKKTTLTLQAANKQEQYAKEHKQENSIKNNQVQEQVINKQIKDNEKPLKLKHINPKKENEYNKLTNKQYMKRLDKKFEKAKAEKFREEQKSDISYLQQRVNAAVLQKNTKQKENDKQEDKSL